MRYETTTNVLGPRRDQWPVYLMPTAHSISTRPAITRTNQAMDVDIGHLSGDSPSASRTVVHQNRCFEDQQSGSGQTVTSSFSFQAATGGMKKSPRHSPTM